MREIEKIQEAYNMCLLFESRLGILKSQLLNKLEKEYNKNSSVYELLHNKPNHFLLCCQLFRLCHKCNQLTPENFEKLINEVIYGEVKYTKEKRISEFYDSMLFRIRNEPNLFPKYPTYHISMLLEALELVRGYYTNGCIDRNSYQLFLNIDFFGRWEELIKLDEDKSELYWLNKLLYLIEIEPNSDNKVTISNILRRKYPKLEEYFTSRGV